MPIFHPIVQSLVLPMFHSRQDVAFGGTIDFERISDDHTRDRLKSFEELAKKSFRCLRVPSALDQDIQHVAILVYSPPEILGKCRAK